MAVRRDGRARREALLDAALRCFARKGVADTGIEDVRREAGASPSSVYHQFAGLQALVLALLVRTFGRLFDDLGVGLRGCDTPEASVRALVGGHIDWVLAHRDEARFMYQALSLELGSEVADELQAEKARQLAPIASHFVRFIESGALPPWSPMVFDVVLLGVSHEACRRYLAGAPLDPQWMRDELPRIAWRSICD